MNPYEFISYQPTPGEKHLGIATIKLWGKLILRFKAIPNKDGSGFFFGTASFKVSDNAGGDSYVEAFMLDSRSEHEAVTQFIRANIKQHIRPSNAPLVTQDSAFNTPMPSYPNGNIAPVQQQPQYQQQSFIQPVSHNVDNPLPF